ncbi:hypothetical protein ACH50O_21950 [Methylomonas sp. 2BW1-5-20]|uniref:hypothetical protein n=1 Tax=Methylomonas sp. 2BW1-5-20 TaxID=3376686 RepID=UPI00404EAE71
MALNSELLFTNKIKQSQKCDTCFQFRYKIKCYADLKLKSDVQDCYDSGTDELKAEFETALDYLRSMERQHWRRPHAHKMSKCQTFKDFFEIRFKANNVQQRPIGYFGPGSDEFTILIWTTEKGGSITPKSWCETANRRRQQIENGTAIAKCIKFDGDQVCIAQK